LQFGDRKGIDAFKRDGFVVTFNLTEMVTKLIS